MIKWIKNNKNVIIRNTFLLPILLVVIMSISHVVSWYNLGNPLNWAIYLSIAIEIFALASVSAATIKVNRASIWFLFGLVTFIQIIGNIFFEYKEIIITDPSFLSWVDLIKPFFDDWDATDHRRLLAIIQGGTLPIMSLTALHYYMKFKDQEEILNQTNTAEPVLIDEPNVEESTPVELTVEESTPVELTVEESTPVEPTVEESKYDPSELKEAINIWGQMHGSIEGISDDEIIKNYRQFIEKRDENLLKQPIKKPVKKASIHPKLTR